MRILSRIMTLTLLATLSLPFAGCMNSVGRHLQVKQVRQIEIGTTTKAEIRQVFGDPWRTGVEDGFRTYTYGEYSVKRSRDLVFRFDVQDVVKSYSFSSSYPEDEKL